MKAIIINGSHRRFGNTWRFSRFVREILETRNFEVEILDLIELSYKICNGCLECEESGECILQDLFTDTIIPKLMDAEVYIFASPVYFNMPTSLMKTFMDRTNSLCSYFEENTKKVFLFLVGQADEESLNSAYRCFSEYFEIMGFDSSAKPIMKIARDINELDLDIYILKTIKKWFEFK